MRTIWLTLALLALAGTGHAAAEPELRVVILSEGELLGSERRALAQLGKHVEQAVRIGDAEDAERAVARAWLAGAPGAPPALPAEWKGAAAVVVLQLLPPRGKKPRRTSGGLGGTLVFRPGQDAPLYVERVEGPVGAPLDAESLGKWLAGAARLAGMK